MCSCIVFHYISLVIVLNYAYSASIAKSERLVYPEELEKIKSSIRTLNISRIVHDNNTVVDPTVPITVPELSDDEAEQILDELGFNNTDSEEDVIDTRFGGIRNVHYKIKRYQRYHGLPETGQVDSATKVSLKMPRCGKSDIAAHGADYRWSKHSLTYYVRNFPSGIAPNTVKQLLRKAFNEWSKVTVIDFTESDNPRADIEILFGSRRHQEREGSCRDAFNDYILAHADYPEQGGIHFNTKFYFGSNNEDDFFNTAVHEIGHSLGLEHSTSKASIMYPKLVIRFSELPRIDVEKIQWKYGKRQQVKSMSLGFCKLPKYNALFYGQHDLYVIAGKYYYTPHKTFEEKLISEMWPGAPDSIDAAFKGSTLIFMFNGEKVWAFNNGMLDAAYPREIKHAFPGLPKNLDAVMKYKSQFIYAFKNGHFWRYNIDGKHVDHSGEVADFGIPGDIDAALYDGTQNKAYFYKGKHTYVYNFKDMQTETYNNLWNGC